MQAYLALPCAFVVGSARIYDCKKEENVYDWPVPAHLGRRLSRACASTIRVLLLFAVIQLSAAPPYPSRLGWSEPARDQ